MYSCLVTLRTNDNVGCMVLAFFQSSHRNAEDTPTLMPHHKVLPQLKHVSGR